MDINSYEMDSGYPDSVNSSPLSRETDSDQRWEGSDSVGGGCRVRLMCSYGGKIQQRSHDNQLSYIGGDTRILAVDRNIRFASIIGKLSSLWGCSVSFKYQLPNEDLDALVSVTNDEDMENMMAEYDRLQKMDYRSSRLRLFVFAKKPEGTSSQSSLGSLTEENKPETWFVDALNVGPVSRSETARKGPWMNNVPDFLFGLGGNGVEDDRNSAQRGYAGHETNSKEQEGYMGRELRQPEVHSAPNCPLIGQSSIDSTASGPARINTSAAPQASDEAEAEREYINHARVFEQDRNLRAKSTPTESNPVQKIGALTSTDRTANVNAQKQEQFSTEFSVVSSSVINERAPQQQPQIPTQDFQKLQLRQPQDTNAWPVDANANLNIPGRKIYSDPVKAVNLSNPDVTRPDPTLDQPYMPQQRQYQQMPSEYYMQDQRSHFVAQGYWQMHEPQGDLQSGYEPVYFMHAGSPGQPAVGAGGGYYNPGQRVPGPMQVYSPEAAPSSIPVTTFREAATIQRQTSSDLTEPYRELSKTPPPVSKGAYTPAPSGPVASDVRVVPRPTVSVPPVHTKPYSYQNVGPYDASSRQIYYTQAPPVTNPQYQDDGGKCDPHRHS